MPGMGALCCGGEKASAELTLVSKSFLLANWLPILIQGSPTDSRTDATQSFQNSLHQCLPDPNHLPVACPFNATIVSLTLCLLCQHQIHRLPSTPNPHPRLDIFNRSSFCLDHCLQQLLSPLFLHLSPVHP